MKTLTSACAVAAALALCACGEKPQTAGNHKDGKAWEGAQNSYVAQGWKPGDQSGWEQQLRKRSQGQDEYSRVAAQP